jgi:hypothetical protein
MISASLPMQTEAMQELTEPRTAGQLPAPLLAVMQPSSKGPTGLGFPQLSPDHAESSATSALGLDRPGCAQGGKAGLRPRPS